MESEIGGRGPLKKFRIKIDSIKRKKALINNVILESTNLNTENITQDTQCVPIVPDTQEFDFENAKSLVSSEFKIKNESYDASFAQNIQTNPSLPINVPPAKASAINSSNTYQPTNLSKNLDLYDSHFLQNDSPFPQSNQQTPTNNNQPIIPTDNKFNGNEFFNKSEGKTVSGFDGLQLLTKKTGDSASDMGSNVSYTARSVVSSTLTTPTATATSGASVVDKDGKHGKFKLKIKKILPITATTTTSLKGIIEQSHHYELPIGAVCITSGVYFDKHFFDAIYPGKTLSSELNICNRNTKSHLQMEKVFHKQRMDIFHNTKAQHSLKDNIENGSSSYNRNRTQKVFFRIEKHAKEVNTSYMGEKIPAKDEIKHLFAMGETDADDFDMDQNLSTEISVNSCDTSLELNMADANDHDYLDKNLSEFINSNKLFMVNNTPPKSFLSQINITAPSCVTKFHSFAIRKVLARRLIKSGYNLITSSTLLPNKQASSNFATGILKSQFSNLDRRHIFYSVDSRISTKITLKDTPFPLSGTYRFVTTTINIVNLSSFSCDLNIELTMENKEITFKEPVNFKYGVKNVQLHEQFKILPPANYASLLFESFHRAIMMKKTKECPYHSMQVNQLLELVSDYMKSDRISLLHEIDSLAKMTFEMGQFPCYKIVIFTPKKCTN